NPFPATFLGIFLDSIDVTTVNEILGGFVTFHLDYPDFEYPAHITWKKGNTLLHNRTYHRLTISSNGTLALENIEKKDEGQYTVSVYNITGNLVYQRIFQLYVHGRCKSIISLYSLAL
uniref:Immunoglobulin I-set domain-containing protein n=1 Tax=Chelonoidis abingdonii TaxID=106734 RepID=A0A8C0GJX8_CHEAB